MSALFSAILASESVAPCDLDGLACTDFLSATTSSMTPRGGRSFGLMVESTATTPGIVGNHKRPSLPFQPAGLETPLHCTLARPSDFPKAVQFSVRVEARSKPARSFLSTRKMPLRQLIQK